MAAAYVTTAFSAGSSQLYQQALALLQQQKFDHAFVAAKRALDSAGGAGVAAQAKPKQTANGGLLLCAQCWQAMAAAAAGMGDTEVAYCLYAKAHEQCGTAAASSQSAAAAPDAAAVQAVVQQLAAGKLQMLAALCQAPGDEQQQRQICRRWQRTKDRFRLNGSSSSSSSRNGAGSRVFCVSDLHVDKAGGANMAWLQRICSSAFKSDVLIVAGDVADTAAAVAAALRLLSSRFRRVVWLPGNHEAWLRPGSRDAALYTDSFAKLLALRQMADECGVDVGPVEVCPGLIVLPLLSWYRAAFDTSDPRPGRYRHDSFCSWPVPDDDVWQVMMRLNSSALALVQARIGQLQQAPGQQGQQQQQQQQQQLVQQLQQQRLLQQSTEQHMASVAVPTQQQQQEQQQQQQLPLPQQAQVPPASKVSMLDSSSSSSVTWNEEGVLAVKSSRRVPGLQLNLKPKPTPATGAGQHQLQHEVAPLPAVRAAAPAAATAAGPGSTLCASPLRVQLQHAVVTLSLRPTAAAAADSLRVPPPRHTLHHHTSSLLAQPATAAAGAGIEAVLAAAAAVSVTVITASHFLPHPQLPHSRFSELAKAMGCCELQLQLEQVSSAVHVYGHSHINADMALPTAAALDTTVYSKSEPVGSSSSRSSSSSSRRYVQYALDAVGSETAGLYCVWDGASLAAPGMIVPVTGP